MSRHTQYRPPRSSTPPTGRPFELRIPTAPDVPHYKSVLTPVSFLLRAALTRPTKLAIVHPERGYHFTYEEWAARVLSLTMALLHVPGWKRGDRVAMICPNVPMMADAHYAVLAAGGILTPLKCVDKSTYLQLPQLQEGNSLDSPALPAECNHGR